MKRFTTIDPIRPSNNWYVYVGNNPINRIDPWGLTAEEIGGNGTVFDPTGGKNQEFLNIQIGLIGSNYVWGGDNPNTDGGVDCSGMDIYALREMGYPIVDMRARDLTNNLMEPIDEQNRIPGDKRALTNRRGEVVHIQTLTEDGRINATGGPENTIDNPGIVEFLEGNPPSSGEYYRYDWSKIERKYGKIER